MPKFLSTTAKWVSRGSARERIVLIGLLIAVIFLAFYNLEYNPRTWHDEGSTLSLAKTLVQDGVYAVRSSEGYQTYGGVQSAGPTVILPIALSFKLLGIGLVQGRIVMAVYTLLTVATFYVLGRELFGPRTALLAVVLLLGSESARFLLLGRQALAEIPALGFFLGGWLFSSRSTRTGRLWLCFIAGLLMGVAMVTKSQYIFMGFGTLGLLTILDMCYYRQGNVKALMITGLIALSCVFAWWGWQLVYFGIDTFHENAAKLRTLAASTISLNPQWVAQAIKFLTGPEAGHFYYLWGFPGLIYIGLLATKRDQHGFVLGFLAIFTYLWLGWWLFLIFPIRHYAYAPMAISALFVGKLWHDLIDGFTVSWRMLWLEIRHSRPARASFRLATLTTIVITACYPLQGRVRADVLEQYQSPQRVATVLNQIVNRNCIIETWERELAVLTDHNYHFPDQSLLITIHDSTYHGGILGADYFREYHPSYLVLGWFGRTGSGFSYNIYDMDFVARYGDLVATVDDYEIYKLHWIDNDSCP